MHFGKCMGLKFSRALGVVLLVSLLPFSASLAQRRPDRALLLATGDEIARATLDMISTAQQEVISMEFLMRDDTFGRMKMALLRQKAQQGLRVVVQVDALHMLVHGSYLKNLMDAGVEVRVFNKKKWRTFWKTPQRDHTKILVVDRKALRTGDSNTGDEYVQWGDGHQMHSRDVYIEGDAARQAAHYADQMMASSLVSVPGVKAMPQYRVTAQRLATKFVFKLINFPLKLFRIGLDAPALLAHPDEEYVSDLEAKAASEKLDAALVDYENMRQEKGWGEKMQWTEKAVEVEKTTFYHDPIGKKGEAPGIDRAVNAFISGAKRSLTLFTPYLVFTPQNEEALRKPLSKNVKVTLGTNSLYSSDNITVQSAYEYSAVEYAAMSPNMEIYEANGPTTWHAKVMQRDEKESWVMGYNIDFVSMNVNMETGVYIKGADFHQMLKTQLVQDQEDKFHLVAKEGKLLPDDRIPRMCRTAMMKPPKMTSPKVIAIIRKHL